MTASGLVDHGHIVSCCLVVLHPATIDKVKLPFGHKVLTTFWYHWLAAATSA